MTSAAGTDRLRVSIGIPIYAARPWVDRVIDNILRNAAPDVEFVLSDQHGKDDAMDVIRERVTGRAHVRCLSSRTREGWIANYNLLLRESRGDYVRILSQDDVLLEQSVARAAETLDQHPETVLVVGPADLIDEAGRVFWQDTRRPATEHGPAGRTPALDAWLMYAGAEGHSTMGLLRRSVLATAGLSIPHTAGESGLSLRVLMFAVALRGRIRYEPEYVSRRCIHANSYTARHWSRSVSDELRRAASYWQAGAEAWRSAPASRRARLLAGPILGAGVGYLVARRAIERLRSPARVK